MAKPAPAVTPPLGRYNAKRDFAITPEPAGAAAEPAQTLSFVIQKHWASRLHYDFRLELDGVMLSWAVPKGPSFDPADKRMAVHVEDHPVSYSSFEGTIPPKQYGAGTVIVWDRGTWEPVGDARAGLAAGKLVFRLHGEKLAGSWELVRIAKPGDRQEPWILFKKRDAWARPHAEYDVITALPDSVVAQPLGAVEVREPRPDAGAALAYVGHADGPPPADAAVAAPDLADAPLADLPETFAPQLATLAAAPPTEGAWVVEHKLDGYRILARIAHGSARLITRNGHDWTSKMATLATAVEALGIESGWLDGEIVVLDEHGAPRFNKLQNAMDQHRNDEIVYVVFDAPYLNGRDLRRLPVTTRRAALKAALAGQATERVRYSDAFDAPPAQLLEAACRLQLEGLILKRADAPYVSRRNDAWLKLKCSLRQEFVVCGFTDRKGAPDEVGGMILGVYEAGTLRHAGNVGTGWDTATGRELHARLVAIEADRPTLDPASVGPGRWSRRTPGGERWARPELVAEVSFSEWTPDGHVRHPVFKGLREDKPATEVGVETAKLPAQAKAKTTTRGAAPGKHTEAAAATAAASAKKTSAARATTPSAKATTQAAKRVGPSTPYKLTHPERVIDASTGLTKLDLARYYEGIAPRLLPHLSGRPVSLVRAPDGIAGELFFQKHPDTKIPGATPLDPALWPGHAALLTIDSVDALLSAAQMNVVEFHTWNSTAKRIDEPDRMVYDLDPGEGVTWAHLQEAATLMRAMLNELGLEAWLKTSGGKGLHVVVPLTPKLDYPVVKAFSQAVVQHMADAIPQRFVAKSGGTNRVGRIFIDYLRNGHGQTTAAAFSARSRPGLGVSMPVSWEQLPELKGGAQWTITTAREYLSFETVDPWAAYRTKRQTLTTAMKRLGFVPPDAKASRG